MPPTPPDRLPVVAADPPASLRRVAIAFGFAGGFAVVAITGPVFTIWVHANLLSAARALAVGAGLTALGALVSAWLALLKRGGLPEGARSEWWPALALLTWGLTAAGAILAAPLGGVSALWGALGGCVLGVSGFTSAWWWSRKRAESEAEQSERLSP